MKRPLALLAVCAAALALPSAAASQPPRHAPVPQEAVAGARVQATSAAQARFVPLANTLSGTITGTVLTFAGSGDAGAQITWSAGSDMGTGTADASGNFALAGVPAAASGGGALEIAPADGHAWFRRWNMTWPDSGTDLGTFQPGVLRVAAQESSDPDWQGWRSLQVVLNDYSDGPSTTSETYLDNAYPAATTGNAEALPGELDAGAVYYWMNQGQEVDVAGTTVTPAVEASPSAGPIVVDQNDAQSVLMDGWQSGKPGTRVTLRFENFPAGWESQISGWADWPLTATRTSFAPVVASGDTVQSKRVTIPSTAAVGYRYYVEAQHTTGPLRLWTWFQTCSLNASKASIRRGASVKLSGVVPVQGHRGSTPGKSKRVFVYKTTSSRTAAKGRPAKSGDSTRVSGWTKVSRVTTNGFGRYASSYLRPSRTTWYVVWYPADREYFGSWTSVRKVVVR